MTNIITMTDRKLQQAIAEEMDLCLCLENVLRSTADDAAGMWCAKCKRVTSPNWPCDSSAAIELLNKLDKDNFVLLSRHKKESQWNVQIIFDEHGFYAFNESLARAISEASYAAMKEE